MAAALAALPIAVVLALIGGLGQSAARAGAAGLAVAVLLALTAFDLSGAAPGGLSPAALGTGAEALHSTATILWVILPALALHAFQQTTGAIGRLRDALGGLTTDRRLQVILIAWFFGLFIEGAAGFGAPVALGAPLLAGFGFAPAQAVILALLGHAAGVSFGAVGTPTLAQVALSGLPGRDIALAAALFHAALGPALLLVTIRLAAPGRLTARDVGWALLAALCFFVPSIAFAALVGPELPSLGGALIGGVAFVALLRRFGPRAAPTSAPQGNLLADLAPYLAILALVLATRLIGPVQETLSGLSLDWTLPGGFSGAFAPLYHPGTLLFAGLAGAALLTGRAGALPGAVAEAAARLAPVALALLAMLTLSRLMVHAGMIDALAATAALTGAAWPLVAPFLGVLGTFVTGSATASNILFTELQVSVAASLGLPPVLMAATQGAGSAIGNVVAPHNIIAGAATVGLVGREGALLPRTPAPGLLYAAALGTLTFIAARCPPRRWRGPPGPRAATHTHAGPALPRGARRADLPRRPLSPRGAGAPGPREPRAATHARAGAALPRGAGRADLPRRPPSPRDGRHGSLPRRATEPDRPVIARLPLAPPARPGYSRAAVRIPETTRMSIFDFLSGQFIDVIHWTSDTRDTLVWRFEREGHEIKYGAKLTVREGQSAVFVHEGQIADVFTPGLYMLETNNMPVMTTLQHWDHGFRSPFKSEVYFVNTNRFTNLKWGTKNPVMLRDPEFGPTRIRAFGTYTIKVTDPALFLREIVGTDGEFTTAEITFQVRNIIVQESSRVMAGSGIPVLDMAANTGDMGRLIAAEVSKVLTEYGLVMPEFYIENISLLPAVEAALDKRTSMGLAGDLGKFTQYSAAEAMTSAAQNQGGAGGGMGAGIGAGLGMAMGGQMAQAGPWGAPVPQHAPQPSYGSRAQAVPPPPPPAEHVWHIAENGATSGPFSRADMGRMAQTGELTRATLVWTPGQDGWQTAEEIRELAQLFTIQPPPPPPPAG